MHKKWRFLLLTVAVLALLFYAAPALLRAVPSRYVARLPEPLQVMGAPRQQAPILPTVDRPATAGDLLSTAADAAGEAGAAQSAPPATLTPVPTVTRPDTAAPTATAAASPTAVAPPASPTPAPTSPPPLPEAARLSPVRHQFQTWNNCGPATLAMSLSYFGLSLTQQQTAAVLKPDPEDRNVSPAEMAAFVNEETGLRATSRANGTLALLRRFLAQGLPVIVEVGIDPPGEYRWLGWYGHYLLLVAYDDAQQQFSVYDSWFGTSEEPLANANAAGRAVPYGELATYWQHFNYSYIVLYEAAQAGLVADLIGDEMDDAIMWQHALERVRADTAAGPENAFNWFNLGTVYNALGAYEDAAVAFDQARAIGLPWRMLWYQFGPYEAYLQVGRYEDIVLLADLTLKDRPYFEESYYYRGLALTALGDASAGRADLERAVAFNPHYQPAVAALRAQDGNS